MIPSFFSFHRLYTMYNIYVTNKTADNVYVRLKPQEITSLNGSVHEELHKMVDDSEIDESYVHTYLVRWGFCVIPPQNTMSFTITIDRSYDGTRMYASLYAASKLWVVDYEVDYINFGCLFVKSAADSVLYFSSVNPEPVWIEVWKGDELPYNVIKAGSEDSRASYFGRFSNESLCICVSSSDNKCSHWVGRGETEQDGQLLQDTGHQLVRVKSGDPVPPNTVVVGVSDSEGSLYLGRFGGKYPCSISTKDGQIKHFSWQGKQAENGEIMVLTNDVSV